VRYRRGPSNHSLMSAALLIRFLREQGVLAPSATPRVSNRSLAAHPGISFHGYVSTADRLRRPWTCISQSSRGGPQEGRRKRCFRARLPQHLIGGRIQKPSPFYVRVNDPVICVGSRCRVCGTGPDKPGHQNSCKCTGCGKDRTPVHSLLLLFGSIFLISQQTKQTPLNACGASGMGDPIPVEPPLSR
jgi:hypothetical protein